MEFRNDFSPTSMMPTKVKYFKEEIISELINLPENNPDMKGILNTLVSANIEETKLIKTEKGLSNEGQKLTGYKLLVKVKIKEKIMYIADYCTQPLHAVHKEDIVNLFIILPKKIENIDICTLLNNKKLVITPCRNTYA